MVRCLRVLLAICVLLYSAIAIPSFFISPTAEAAEFTFTKIADTSTAIPDGTGVFTSFSPPSLDQGSTVVFHGSGSGQKGIYASSQDSLLKIADLNTSIPEGAGFFTAFSGFSISNNLLYFIGMGSGQVGIYKYGNGQLSKVADTHTLVPGKTTYFSNFTSLSSDYGSLAFECRENLNGMTNLLGICEYRDGTLSIMINARNPNDNLTFNAISTVCYDSNSVVFPSLVNNSSSWSIYSNRYGSLEKIADTTTLIPDGDGKTFAAFGQLTALDNQIIAFYGYASEDLSSRPRGIYIDMGDGLKTLVDRNTSLPGNIGSFTRFSVISLDNGKGIFRADNESKAALFFTDLNGNFYKIIESDEILDGKIVQNLSIGNESLAGTALAFNVIFNDGSSAIYRADLPNPSQSCAYTYSDWGACQSNGTQTRTVLTATPDGCTGIPVLSQSCPTIELSPTQDDFGTLNVGSCSGTPQQFTLSNTGGADLMVSDISLSDTTNFKLHLDGGSIPCNNNNPTITPNNSCTITIEFCPTTAGIFNASLQVSSNDPEKNLSDVPISGSGLIQTKGQTAPGQFVIIDGIQIMSILNPGYPDDYSHRLMDAITSEGDWVKKIQHRVGTLKSFVWSRTKEKEDEYVLILSKTLEKYTKDNENTGGKLVVLAHSWGTVLSYVAIRGNTEITVNKFISLGSPLNSQNNDVRSYTIDDLSGWQISQFDRPTNIVEWDNFWAGCDPISGQIPFADENIPLSFNNTGNWDPETLFATCHGAYYRDPNALRTILLLSITSPKGKK